MKNKVLKLNVEELKKLISKANIIKDSISIKKIDWIFHNNNYYKEEQWGYKQH